MEKREGPPPVNFYLKFMMKGVERPFVYTVNKSEWDRVSDLFREDRDVAAPTFVSFLEGEQGRVVHINPNHVLLHQALFDAGWTVPEKAEEGDYPNLDRVTFYIDGLALPLHYDHMDESDIGDLNFSFHVYSPDEAAFISFTDVDGEQNSIRAEKVMLVESPDYEADPEEDE
ncbi:MAG: hypothetical protein ACREBG_15200 [Pyrinomonadaceae bacterium]